MKNKPESFQPSAGCTDGSDRSAFNAACMLYLSAFSVREVRHASFPVSRYPTMPHYTLGLALTIGNQDYCFAYETPVLDEVHELVAASGHEVGVVLNGKKALLNLQNGRQIHANLTKLSEC